MLDRFFTTIEEGIRHVSDWFAAPISHYCDLETIADDHTLVSGNGSMITVIQLEGVLSLFGKNEHREATKLIHEDLLPYFKQPGHILQVVIERDPQRVMGEIKKQVRPMRNTALNYGIEIDSLFDDQCEYLSQYCASEKIWIACWTLPTKLPGASRKRAKRAMQKADAKQPKAQGLMRMNRVMGDLKTEHTSFIEQITTAFNSCGIYHQILDVREALWWTKHCIDPEITSEKWTPILPGDKFAIRKPDPGEEIDQAFVYPSLRRQLFKRPADVDGEFLQIGNKLHSPFMLDLGPLSVKPFNDLWGEMIKYDFPWRMSMRICGDGMNILNLQRILNSVIGFTNSKNKKFSAAIDELKKLEEANESLVDVAVVFDTWIDATTADAEKELHNQVAQMTSAIQSWGTCEVGFVVGDPMWPFSATVPALTSGTPANKAVAPLYDIISMLPFDRSASPWTDGNILFRSPDGKLFPYEHFSSIQTSWIELCAAKMGAGKSVLLNKLNFDYLLQPGLTDLPYLGIIDIGFSSRGLITLLKTILPEDKKHQVVAEKLRNKKEYAINPFDTLLGVRFPLEHHLSYINNLLCTFCTPLGETAPPDGVDDIISQIVRKAYEDMSDMGAKIYNTGLDKTVDVALKEYGGEIEISMHTTWWDVVDFLYKKGLVHEATLAQRHAMPLLHDMNTYLNEAQVKATYNFAEPKSGQPITDYISRKISEAITTYPVLSAPTQFDIGDARVISLDLDEVAIEGGPKEERQLGIMYMTAMHIVAGKFMLQPEDVRYIDEPYKEFHRKQIKSIRESPKRLCVDEYHRAKNTGGVNRFIDRIVSFIRVSRKLKFGLALYSQEIFDFSQSVINLATSIFILGTGSSQSYRKRLVEEFGLNATSENAIRKIGHPDHKGSKLFGILDTSKGRIKQLFMLTLGAKKRWAFNSTSDDVAVRNNVMQQLGNNTTIDLLSQLYPNGVQRLIEARRKQYSNEGREVDVIEELVQEVFSAHALRAGLK